MQWHFPAKEYKKGTRAGERFLKNRCVPFEVSQSWRVTSCDTVHWAFHGSEFNLCLAWAPPRRHFVTVSSVYLKRPNESSLFFFFSLWLNCVWVHVCVWKREIPFWAASLPFINKRCSLETNRQGAGPGYGLGVLGWGQAWVYDCDWAWLEDGLLLLCFWPRKMEIQ